MTTYFLITDPRGIVKSHRTRAGRALSAVSLAETKPTWDRWIFWHMRAAMSAGNHRRLARLKEFN